MLDIIFNLLFLVSSSLEDYFLSSFHSFFKELYYIVAEMDSIKSRSSNQLKTFNRYCTVLILFSDSEHAYSRNKDLIINERAATM